MCLVHVVRTLHPCTRCVVVVRGVRLWHGSHHVPPQGTSHIVQEHRKVATMHFNDKFTAKLVVFTVLIVLADIMLSFTLNKKEF